MSEAKNIPDFLVIGSQKCATSWLYDCLSEHPEICVPKHKKEIEYIGGHLYKENGLDWYLSLFDHCEGTKVKGAVSVEYIVNDESPGLLFDINPGMKFILNVRDPADRAISALKWYTRKGAIPDSPELLKPQLEEAVKAFDKTPYRLMEYNLHDVLYRGLYNMLLEKYYAHFRKENFLVIHYEDIKKDPEKTLKKIFAFLNVDVAFIPQSMVTQPKKNSGNRFLVKLERLAPKNRFVAFIVDKLHQVIPEKKSASAPENEISSILKEFYAQRNEMVKIK
jgi:Sulfotransferase domain